MTDTTIRVSTEARKRLKAYAAVHDLTHDRALKQLLEQADAPEVVTDGQ
jgi:predicted transcriptional regulator